MNAKPRDPARWKFPVVLAACLVLSLVCLVYPIYVIRPFRFQGARELALALAVLRIRPALTVISALVAVAAVVAYWRGPARMWRCIAATLAAILVCGIVPLARVNVYELMFHPVEHPDFAPVANVTLDKDDKLITVKVAGSARGYPIRTMGYHHIVNDLVGGAAIVATY